MYWVLVSNCVTWHQLLRRTRRGSVFMAAEWAAVR